jgi:prevent-host-death family protein
VKDGKNGKVPGSGERTVNIHEAKTHLSRILRAVEKGKEVIITRNGDPVARLSPIEGTPRDRHFGELKGQIVVPDNFNDPLPEEIQKYFEGRGDD